MRRTMILRIWVTWALGHFAAESEDAVGGFAAGPVAVGGLFDTVGREPDIDLIRSGRIQGYAPGRQSLRGPRACRKALVSLS